MAPEYHPGRWILRVPTLPIPADEPPAWVADAEPSPAEHATLAPPAPAWDPGRMIQLVCRFRAADEGFDARSHAALTLLAAQPACRRLLFARSTEEPAVRVLTAEFDTFSGYRSALSPFDVRTVVIPFLSEAEPASSSVLEVVLEGVAGVLVELETVVDPAAVSTPS